jgi:hypothetical protein
MKVIAGILGGLILAVLGAILASVTFAASNRGALFGVISFLVFWVIGIVVALNAKAAAKAWRRLLLSSAVLSFLLPIAAIVFTGSFIATRVPSSGEYAGAQTAGAAIGGVLVSGFMGFVGFFLGIIFLVIGLLVGRDKQIIYVQVPAPPTAENR